MKIIVASTSGTTVKKEVAGKPGVFDYILVPTFTATIYLSQEQDAWDKVEQHIDYAYRAQAEGQG